MSTPVMKLDRVQENPFMDGPAQFVAKTVANQLRQVEQFKRVFGEFIDDYMRMDYPATSLPALRIYHKGYSKESESWFIDGDLFLDIIWPSALRRTELQQLPDMIASALLQQFRRITFFNSVENAERPEDESLEGFKLLGVPGLNELGKRFSVDSSLGFQLTEDDVAPLTQVRVNFRVDLRVWDQYLEDELRTKDDPFEQTLGDLEELVSVIEAYREGQVEPELTVEFENDLTEE